VLTVAISLLAASAIRAQNPTSQFNDLAARAAAARDQQNLPLALELYAQAEQLNPNWAEGWWNLALLNYNASQYAPAIEALNRLLQLEPHAAPAMALRGLCAFETGAYDDSLRDLELAVAHGAADDPSHGPILRYDLGLLLTRTGRFSDALAQYRFLAVKHDDDPDLPLAIALAGMRVRSLPQDVNAQDRELYEAAGKAGYAFLADHSNDADTLFRQLFARYPVTPRLHYFYGILLSPHDRGMALEQFQQEVAISPSDEISTALLAFMLMYAGRYSEALPFAERAVAAAPGIELAQLALARSLIETGDEMRGLDLLNQVLQHDPDSLEAHQGLVAAYSRAGRREDAYRERMVCLGLVK
jgi:tetratricopeptide (TPR) repeat protein